MDTLDGSSLMNTARSAMDRDCHQETNISMSHSAQKAQHTSPPSDFYYTTTADYDVQMQIMDTIREMDIVIPTSHVKGHQDSKKHLSYEARLNIQADLLATRAWQRHFTGHKHVHYPASQCSFYINNQVITRAYCKTMRRAYASHHTNTYLHEKYKWDDAQCESVDWYSHGSSIGCLPHNILRSRNGKTLPLEEKNSQHGGKLHESLCKAFNKHKVDPNLRKLILQGLVAAISDEPSQQDPVIEIRDVPHEYKHLADAQNALGWYHLWYGRYHLEWDRYQRRYLTLVGETDEVRSLTAYDHPLMELIKVGVSTHKKHTNTSGPVMERMTIVSLVDVLNACTQAPRLFPNRGYTKDQGHGHQKGTIILSLLRNLHGGFVSHKRMLGEQTTRNKKGNQPNFSGSNHNNTDEILWCSSKHKSFLGRTGHKKDILMRKFLLRIEQTLDASDDFELIPLYDKDMGLSNDIVQWLSHDFWSRYRMSFRKKIGSHKFNVGAFKYHIAGGNNTVHMVLFKVPHGCTMEDDNVMMAFKQAADEAPRHANRAETNDCIAAIKEASNLSTKKTLAIVKSYFKSQGSTCDSLGHVWAGVQAGDFDGDSLMDMHTFNIRGNTDQSEFETFYKGVIDLLELDGTGAHDRRHSDGREELGGAATYMSRFISLEDIIRETCTYLDDKGGQSYKVPSSRMLAYHQFSPNHEHRKMATMFTGKLGVKHKIQSRNARANHGHGHWVAKLNQHWCYSLVNIRNLVEDASCDIQWVSGMLPWNAAIYTVGLDDKAGIPVGRKVALSATQRQSGRTIVSEKGETVAGDHDFKCDKVVASVIHQLNIAKDVEEFQYSGEPEGNGTIAVALHDSTLEPSDVFTHNAYVSLMTWSR
eukprot:scaffold24367_cov73-Attheya_sp.AAC.2